MRRIVTISYTGLNAGGGVPKFNRDLHSAFSDRECIHFCFDDFFKGSSIAQDSPNAEWERAKILNAWLINRKFISKDDVIIADGFWADGLQHLPYAISHSHGIWGHITFADVLAGKQPENTLLHAAQINFRRRWTQLKKPLTAVSEFIAYEMMQQWGFESHVINNGVDTEVWKPGTIYVGSDNRIIVHGVNDRGNVNKGFDHISKLMTLDVSVLSLDDFSSMCSCSKQDAMAGATIIVHPSGFEGNSMFVAEALASGTPIIGYNVGFLWSVKQEYSYPVSSLDNRSPENTVKAVKNLLNNESEIVRLGKLGREIAVEKLSIDRFNKEWRSYVEAIENG